MKSFKELKEKNLLTRVEQNNLRGGYPTGTCGYLGSDGSHECGVNKGYALFMHDWLGGWWCCDSCPETSYCAR